MAACLWAGQDSVVSHFTASRLHRLEGIPRERRHEPIELTAPLGRRLRAPGLLVHRTGRLEPADRSEIDGIPVTSMARTLLDLSAMLDERHLSIALDSVLARHRGAGLGTFRRTLERLRSQGRTGACALKRLLEERASGIVHLDSALERRFSVALQQAGLPRPAEHYDVVEGGRHVAELDFAYPRERLGIELNGASIHRRHSVWQRDQQRLSDLAAVGWRVLHVTWSQLEMNEAAVMDSVRRALTVG
jgi:hypothetical protein